MDARAGGARGHTLSRPGRADARRADGNARRSRTRTTTRHAPRDCLPSQLERTTGRARAADAPVVGAAAAGRPVEPPISLARAARRARERRSGRVSGIRPSDRRGPGPAGHRGRNVRSTGRCSYNLRITRRRADSCGLHRSTSQVIRRSGSGVFVFLMSTKLFVARAAERARLVFRR